MTDTRNIAHDKTVADEKKYAGEDIAPGATSTPQPGRKPPTAKDDGSQQDEQQSEQRAATDAE